MPFVSVKCPSCGSDIQLDASREFGFCVYYGAKVMYKEAVQKIEGNVTVEGISGLEKLLANAETFHNLKDIAKEKEVLTKITQEYPEDWRGWYQLALCSMADCCMPSGKAHFDFGVSEILDKVSTDHAIQLAPREKAQELKQSAWKCIQSYLHYCKMILKYVEEGVQLAQKQKRKWTSSIKYTTCRCRI